MTKSAIFVVDIQNYLATDPKTRIPHADRLRASVTQILNSARSLAEKPVLVFVQHVDEVFVVGSEPWGLVFNPQPDASNELLVSKTAGNTFESNPDLATRLKSEGIEHIYVVGIQSDYCVQKTSKGALESGFKVSVLQGAHSTYDEGGKTALEIERAVEDTLKELGANIVPWEEALEGWNANGAVY